VYCFVTSVVAKLQVYFAPFLHMLSLQTEALWLTRVIDFIVRRRTLSFFSVVV